MFSSMNSDIIIGLFQAVIVILQFGIWRSNHDHEHRLRELEQFAARSWTRVELDEFRDKVIDQLEEIRLNCAGCVAARRGGVPGEANRDSGPGRRGSRP